MCGYTRTHGSAAFCHEAEPPGVCPHCLMPSSCACRKRVRWRMRGRPRIHLRLYWMVARPREPIGVSCHADFQSSHEPRAAPNAACCVSCICIFTPAHAGNPPEPYFNPVYMKRNGGQGAAININQQVGWGRPGLYTNPRCSILWAGLARVSVFSCIPGMVVRAGCVWAAACVPRLGSWQAWLAWPCERNRHACLKSCTPAFWTPPSLLQCKFFAPSSNLTNPLGELG